MEPGAIFGSYRLLEPLGEGGMGVVWKALDLRLERVVALKVLKEPDELKRKALIAEAKTASQLTHPNIAVIFDAGEVEGMPYIAMEFVEGRTLLHQLGRAWEESDLRRLASQAAEALDHAHQKGIVHRDIKPANLVVTPEGRLEILDFGVAKRTSAMASTASGETTGSEVTQLERTLPGLSMGTPAYMSPEQVRGVEIGPASDQFSLGVVLRELAAAKHPFRKDNIVETLHAILKDDLAPLAKLRPDLSPPLTRVFDRMLEKNPAHRFSSLRAVGAMLGDLQGLGAGPIVLPDATTTPQLSVDAGPPGSQASPPKGRPRKGWLRLGLTVLVVGVSVGAWWQSKSARTATFVLPTGPKVVAVLPLESIGVSADKTWVGTSLVDAMSTGLLRRGDLMVLDRLWVADAMTRLGDAPGQPSHNFQKLVKELKADVLVLGSYQLVGDKMRVNVRLMDGARGAVTDHYSANGTTEGLLTLEDDLQHQLPGMLGLRPAQEAPNPHARAKNPRTRELYAKASDLAAKGNADSFEAARSVYIEALSQEPDYAPAHAGLARALQGMAASEGHLGKGEASKSHFAEAEKEAREAIRLDPDLAFAHRVLAGAINLQGRFLEAREAAARAVALDPADFQSFATLGDAYGYQEGAEAHATARQHYQRSLELAPDYWFAHFRLAVLLQNDGDLEGSVTEADAASKAQPSAEYTYLTSGVSLLWLGRPSEARTRLEMGLRNVPSSKLMKLTLALAAHDLHDADTFRRFSADIRGAWPSDHVISILIEGLGMDMAGDKAGARTVFLAYLHHLQTPQGQVTAAARRSVSVNLYHMARALAFGGEKAAAQELLEEADRLNPGKKIVASKDSAFK